MPNMDHESAMDVCQFKEDLKAKGEYLILCDIPRRIMELNDVMQSAPWTEPNSREEFTERPVHKVTGAEVKPVLAHLGSNQKLVKLIEMLKPISRQLVNDSNVLKMWVSLMIPKIEDGNNFGVSIQEDTLAEIQAVESEGNAFHDQIAQYYVTRATLVAKAVKYPDVEDYRRAVDELDDKQHFALGLALREIRNHYAALHDMVTKNLDKLKVPRNSNAESLY